jgi:hypothetical protein
MSNDTAKTITTNIVPVQGTFEPLPPYECINLIGPAGTPFFAPVDPNLDGVSITNSTINSTTIGVTTPAAGAFTSASATNQPIGNNDLTTKLYVDSLALGISWKQPVNAATTTNITLSGAQTIDTVSVVAGDRVLVKNQTAPAENGIYLAAAGAWSRSPDANLWDELVSALVFVESGAQAGSAWYCPVQPGGTLGVTAITWNNFSVGGVYFAGTGLNLSGGDTFNITNTGVTAATYGSASTVPAIAVNLQGQITSATNTSIAIAGSAITSGTVDSARISGSYTGITAVGTLSGLTVSSTISGSISGNAATATTATSATTATTATNIAGGAAGSVPYQSGAGATTFLAAGSNGQVLTLASGVPSWATPTTGTVTSVSTAGTVNGLTLTGGPITGSGTVTLGGTLDLSAPPTIGNTTANTGAFTTLSASTSVTTPIVQATNSGGLALRNSAGTTQISMGGGGGDNVSINVSTNLNGSNAQIDISPTGTGHVHIKPTGAGSIEIAPTNAGTINNMSIGGTTAAAAKVTTLDIASTLALAGSTGTAGYVLTSNGASAPTWNANANGVTITDDTTTNATRYLTFSELTAGTETTLDVSSTKLQFNPSTGVLSSTSFTGAGTGLTGTASSLSIGGNAANVTGTVAVANGGTGQTTYTNGQLLIGNTTGNTLTKSTLTAGSGISITNGTGSITIASSSTQYTRVALTSGSSWTVPAGVTSINVLVVGGGGGGASNNRFGAGGCGGGGCNLSLAFATTPGASIAYSIGGGGATGSNGSSSTFGSLTATGGFAGPNSDSTTGSTSGNPPQMLGGNAQSASNGEAGGGGGSAQQTGGQGLASVQAGGGGNGLSITINDIQYWYGGGGGGGGATNSLRGQGGLGGGGNGADSNGAGVNATAGTANTGGGGGGGGGGRTGAAGGSGVIIIWY